jgi:hypothetical protein
MTNESNSVDEYTRAVMLRWINRSSTISVQAMLTRLLVGPVQRYNGHITGAVRMLLIREEQQRR